MKSQVSRSVDIGAVAKAALRAAAVAVPALLASAGAGQAQSVFRGVSIDMSAIPGGAAETRRDLAVCLQRTLPQAFGGRVNPGARGAPLLVVRPTSVWLAALNSATVWDDLGGGTTMGGFDSLEGEAIVGGQRVPLTVSASADFGAQGAPDHMARVRLNSLCQNFAYWLARKV